MTPAIRTPVPPGPGPGLLLRLWVGCLGSAVAVAAGLWFVVTREPAVTATLDSELVWVWLPAIGGGGLLIGVLLAVWLSRGIARPLRGVSRGLATGQVAELRGLPSGSGWGEVSDLALQAQRMISRHAQLTRAGAELDLLHQQIERMREALDRWARTGRAESIEPEVGPLRNVALALQRAMARVESERGVAAAASDELGARRPASLHDARESAEQAERAFVESTSLLTTVRELERLSAELHAAMASAAGSPAEYAVGYGRYRTAAAEAIEELVSASTASVGHLAHGMERVAEVSELVHVVANRATLIALNAVSVTRGETSGAEGAGDVAGEFKMLAREVRAATDRATELARGIEADVATARERMQSVRGRVAEVLDLAPAAPQGETASATEGAARLLDRVREMVQDAALKGERLSASGERASRAAESLMRRLEEEARTLERLATVMNPGGAHPESEREPAEPKPSEAPSRPLRLLGREDLEEDAGGRRERR